MSTWTPLFKSIVNSSIWGEELHVKVVWITLLALKDRDGFVETSIPGLARAAVVTPEQCKDAISKLESPDPDSVSQENEGRRIKRVARGFVVLNHGPYQELMREVTTRIGNAKRQAKFRAKSKPLPGEVAYVKALNDGLIQETPPAYGNGI